MAFRSYFNLSENNAWNRTKNENTFELNLSDGSSPEDPYNDDVVVVTAWTAMAVFGFVSNILILIGILHTKKLYQSTSYWLIISLSFCDMSMILVCLCHLAPATVLHERYVNLVDFSNAFGIFVYDGFWYTGVLHLMIMSINRYVSICTPKYYLNLFSRRKTAFIIGSLYVGGLAVAIPGLFECCYVLFNSDIYAVQFEPADTPYQYVDMAINGSSILIMTFCYSCIVVRVRRSRVMLHQYRKLYKEQRTIQTKAALAYATQRDNRENISGKFARLFKPNVPIISRREVRLFFQFATVSGIFLASVATWGWLPQLSESKWVGFTVTSLFFLNNSTNPTVYLIFNNILRRQIQRVLCPFRAAKSSTTRKSKHHRTVIADDCGLGLSGGIGQFTSTRYKRTAFGGRGFMNSLRLGSRKKRESVDVDFDSSEYQLDSDERRRRRSTIFGDEDGKLTRLRDSNLNNATRRQNGQEEVEDPDLPPSNATCNLMAMAAFLNTSTVAGRVLLKTVDENDSNTGLDHKLSVISTIGIHKNARKNSAVINQKNVISSKPYTKI